MIHGHTVVIMSGNEIVSRKSSYLEIDLQAAIHLLYYIDRAYHLSCAIHHTIISSSQIIALDNRDQILIFEERQSFWWDVLVPNVDNSGVSDVDDCMDSNVEHGTHDYRTISSCSSLFFWQVYQSDLVR